MNFRMAMLSGVSSPTSAFAASARATSSSQSSKSTKYPSSSTVTFLLAYCSSTGIKTPSPFHYHLRLSNINYKSQFHDGQGWLSFFKGRALDVVVNPAVPERKRRSNSTTSALFPLQLQSGAFNKGHAGAVSLSFSIENIRDPSGITGRGVVHPKMTHLRGYHSQGKKLACLRIHLSEIHEPEVGAKRLISADSFIVVQKVAATVEDELAAVHLDRFQVMGRMAMNDIHARLVNKTVAETLLLG